MGRIDNKVALITGAARGQGRSHAVRLAEEGADIIALDICSQIPTADHTMGTEEELQETAEMVERLGRRVFAKKADVRDREGLGAAISEGVATLGHLDIVSVNAGITSLGQTLDLTSDAWKDVNDVNLGGAWNTAVEAIPHIQAGGRGGSVVFTGSAADQGLRPTSGITTRRSPGFSG